MSNILDAIVNLVNNPVVHLREYYHGRNRANNVGDALEEYVKDMFAGTFGVDEKERIEKISETFSYLGNNSNPPDAMLKNGDAIEVKKIESFGSALALNSSYPKHSLKSSSPMISKACRNAEKWLEKDIIYIVGIVDKSNNNLCQLCMVYGRNYCADEDCYSRIKSTIKNGVEAVSGVEFSETKELGHINKVDPLGITYMRIRGMWGIENPLKVFNYVYKRNTEKDFSLMCIIDDKKWNSFDNTQFFLFFLSMTEGISIENIKIKNPDNPAVLLKAKLIRYEQ